MLGTYYTLAALASEWRAQLAGTALSDVFSSQRDEVTLVLAPDEGSPASLRISFRGDLRYLFRQDGGSRPKRNVTTLFEEIIGHRVLDLAVADRDRVLDFELTGAKTLRIVLFGPRANALLITDDDRVLEAFRTRQAPEIAPAPRPAPRVATVADLRGRWPAESQPMERAVRRAFPLADSTVAEEVVARAALDIHDACLVEAGHLERILAAFRSVEEDCLHPRPCVYRTGRQPHVMSLFPLTNPPGHERQDADSVDEAVRVFVRATLSEQAFRSTYDPLVRLLQEEAARATQRVDRMESALLEPSRAERYEQWGHLLMAGPDVPAGLEEATLDNMFGAGEAVTIPLDEALTRYENAATYYDRARRTRRSREEAETRYDGEASRLSQLRALLAGLDGIENRSALRQFEKDHGRELDQFRRAAPTGAAEIPFRRYVLESGYEVWVGRNAKQNDALTFRHAKKHDYWLHARGVGGSHVVLRRPRKSELPPGHTVERAAEIAAYYSKARGSALVPVIVTERKFVRKPRGAAPGAVIVEREEVVIVEPRVP